MTTNTITIQAVDGDAFKRADNLLARADGISITTQDQCEEAAEVLRGVKAFANEIEEGRKAAVSPLNKVVKEINDAYRGPAERCKDAETKIKRAIGAWQAEQERQRKEREDAMRREREAEQARLRAEAEREQAKERERARIAKEKADKKAAELEAAGKHERAEAMRKQAEADRLERERIAAEEAERLRQQAAMAPAAVVEAPPPKPAGISSSKRWKWETVDFAAMSDAYKTEDSKKITRVVNALGDECGIAGIRVWQETSIAARASA